MPLVPHPPKPKPVCVACGDSGKASNGQPCAPCVTLADHAEAWFKEHGQMIPSRGSDEWNSMYTAWIEYAFDKSVIK